MAAFTRTGGAAGNASTSAALAASTTRTFTIDLSAVQFGVLNVVITSGGTVNTTAGVNISIFQGAGSTIVYETVASVSAQVPVVAVSTTTTRTTTLPQGVYQVQITNTDPSNSVTALATLDTYV